MHGGKQHEREAGQKSAAASSGYEDWFLASVCGQQGLRQALATAQAALSERLEFVSCLQKTLFGGAESAQAFDVITGLSHRINTLEQTLRVRLPLLRPDRPAAWFRPSAVTHGGPFSGSILNEPIFTAFAGGATCAQVRQALLGAWQQRLGGPLPLQGQGQHQQAGVCLWVTLLRLNSELAALGQLPPPFAMLSLRASGLALSPAIESPMLREFCRGVRMELERLDAQLAGCYQRLQAACAAFWPAYEHELAGAAQRQQTRESRYQGESGGGTSARQRSAATSYRSPRDIEALKTLGFSDFPSAPDLKQRYRVLARQLHPDLAGGDEAGFKHLLAAYSHLQGRVQGHK